MLYKSLLIIYITCLQIIGFEKTENITKNDSLTVLKIKNTELSLIVDSLVVHEKQMDYYDTSLLFYIDIHHRRDITLIAVGSCHKIIKSGTEIGCLKVKNHLFIISSNYETDLFRKTLWKKKFDFYKPIEEANDSPGVVKIDIYEDDSYTQWNFRLVDEKLIKIE